MGNLSCTIVHAASCSATLLHLVIIDLQSFMFEPRCFDKSYNKLESSKNTTNSWNVKKNSTIVSCFTKAMKKIFARINL